MSDITTNLTNFYTDLINIATKAKADLVPPPNPTGEYKAITDRLIRVKPTLPTLGPAGFKFTDPTFGQQILRMTDGSISYRTPDTIHGWSADSKRLILVNTTGNVLAYKYDSAAFTTVFDRQLQFVAGASFHHLNANFIYGPWFRNGDEAMVQECEFSTNTYQTIVGVRDLVSNVDANGRTYLRGVQNDGKKIVFIFGGTSQDKDHYLAMVPLDGSTPTVINSLTEPALGIYLHAVNMDLSGRYIVLGATQVDINNGKAPNYVYDTVSKVYTPMTMHPGGHGGMGYNEAINNPDDSDSMQWLLRALSIPNTVQELVLPYPVPADFQASSHASWNNAPMPIMAGMFRYGNNQKPWREWDEEIIAISRNPTKVYRLAHHRSNTNVLDAGDSDSYWYCPRPSVSPDGLAVAFTSNWEKTLGTDSAEVNKRQDVFLIKLQTV